MSSKFNFLENEVWEEFSDLFLKGDKNFKR